MAERRDLLVEIGTEELPPKALAGLAQALLEGVVAGLDEAGVGRGEGRCFATPRRLAVRVAAVATAQPDRVVERRGPALRAAFDAEGCPTRAAEGFARACGVAVEALERLETPQGAWLVHRRIERGRPTAELLPGIVSRALDRLPVPKRMRWGDLEEAFVRPVHWIVLLLGGEVVPMRRFGIASGRASRGHRFHHPGPVELAAPAEYEQRLETEGRVLVDLARRRARIREQVEEAAREAGGRALVDEALLDEVAALVEWPVAVAGRFEERFLALPREVLVSTMQDHQRYFPVEGEDGGLLPWFVTVANIESRDPARVREGNERVIRPRLADAAFFWEQDRRRPLAARREALAGVVFHERLGSLLERSDRIARLAAAIAERLGGDADAARRAGELAKCDLVTEMVGEFPELQGIMGRYYALHDGEPEAVAEAIAEHYRPAHAGDRLPATAAGRALALADRIDTLVGIFAAGERPSGEKDPYGLRRAAIGVLRILIEGELALDLRELLAEAAAGLAGRVPAQEVVDEVLDYCLERLRAYYAEAGCGADAYDAVRAVRPTAPLDFHRRLEAVEAFHGMEAAAALAAAHKRIRNILRKAAPAPEPGWDDGLLAEEAERALADALAACREALAPLLAAGRYREALERLAALRPAVDRFFDEVLVMAEDEAVRRNRLGLLAALGRLLDSVADISRLRTA
ncbi:glycine--tRNA ligase subunit beta [Inmirania thermothiophila]|uniref:Glycine--tRNA ligase beta subunit n=1 Tax=Inmirania thermothiophila TaxID=1750597 RepID=A0A3N1Y6C9_9GAMM|nr:glycine--tRNA ligase subunit beta [Inmirania thermothiophila]ROR34363.1 glycyl-tRNA synthetase beta chain [Inmirania thermothiophila]